MNEKHTLYVCKSRPDWLELLGRQLYYKPVEILAAYKVTDRLNTLKEVGESLASAKLWDTSYLGNDVIVKYKDYFPFKEPKDPVKTAILNRYTIRPGYCSGLISSTNNLQTITLEEYSDYLFRHQTLPDRLTWLAYIHYLEGL